MLLIALVLVLLMVAFAATVTWIGTRAIERAHPPVGHFVEVDGRRLHVLDVDRRTHPRSDDLPLVLLHGASGNLGEMRFALADALARRYRVILVDRPGHGWSERTDDGASPARQAAMIRDMLDRLGVGRAVIVAHSFAATVATALALEDPEHVAGLALIAPALYPWPGGISWYYVLSTTPLVGSLFVRVFALPAGLALLKPTVASVFSPQAPPEGYLAQTGISLVLRPRTFLANARDVAGLKAFVTAQAPRYGTIRAPTTIITGDQDSTLSPEIHAHALAKALPHSKLIVLEGMGHMPHHGARERVVAAIDELVESLCVDEMR